jgi:hypothetical protein
MYFKSVHFCVLLNLREEAVCHIDSHRTCRLWWGGDNSIVIKFNGIFELY